MCQPTSKVSEIKHLFKSIVLYFGAYITDIVCKFSIVVRKVQFQCSFGIKHCLLSEYG